MSALMAAVPVPGWADAACRGVAVDLFYPALGESTGEAKMVCKTCVCRVECLEFALVNNEKFGIWGGMSERQRRTMRRGRRTT